MKKRISKLKGGLFKKGGGYCYYFGSIRGPFTHTTVPLTQDLAAQYLGAEVEQARKQFGDNWKIEFIREDLDFEKENANQN